LAAYSQTSTDSLQNVLRYELMYENYQKVIELTQNTQVPELLIAKAQALFALYRYDDTDRLLDSILANNPNYVPALMLYAKTAGANGNKIESIKRYQRVLAVDSLNNAVLNILATNAFTNKNYHVAIPYYETLYQQNKLNSLYPTRLGMCYSAFNDNRTAIRYLLEALIISPKNISALVSIINAYYGEALPDSSKYYIDYGLGFAPENPELLRRNAVWFYAEKRYNESVDFFKKTLEAGDSSVFVYKYAGMAAMRCDSFDNYKIAYNYFAKAYALDSDDVQTCYSRGIAASNLSEYNLAIQLFNRAKFLLTPDKSILYSIDLASGDNYSRFKQYQQAI
ncbi:MAG TPA: hypothetical protein DCQ31_18865, partial [Bacteroidales bacterium]|nr:hypothetical protein [Bacteroidales bacterium]